MLLFIPIQLYILVSKMIKPEVDYLHKSLILIVFNIIYETTFLLINLKNINNFLVSFLLEIFLLTRVELKFNILKYSGDQNFDRPFT
jgi:hypothetical protein